MKAIIFACIFALCAFGYSSADLQCHHKIPDVPQDWITMVEPCTDKMRKQVQQELDAAIQYMAMGAHFSKDTVNRPGFAQLFFEAASEERQHAIKLISYLLMRGGLSSQVSNLIKTEIEPEVVEWKSGLQALKDALQFNQKSPRKSEMSFNLVKKAILNTMIIIWLIT